MQGMGPLRCCIGPLSLSPKIHQQLQEVRDCIKKRSTRAITRQDMNMGCRWKRLALNVNTAVNGVHERWGSFPFCDLVVLNNTSSIKTNIMKCYTGLQSWNGFFQLACQCDYFYLRVKKWHYAGEVWLLRVVIWTCWCILWWSNQRG
jgi:hypothetical protein